MSTSSRRHARHVAVAAAALALAAMAAPALGAGNYGADTCLQGYVWRGAIPTDHVCVTPLVRMQTAEENDQAAAHRDPARPDTCLNGYVWREAVAGDHVCVFPARRQQARDDNAQVAARRNSLHVWLTRYRPSQPPCTGSTCSQHSDDAQRYRVRADHINLGNRHRARALERPGPGQDQELVQAGRAEPGCAGRSARLRQRSAALPERARERRLRGA